MNFDEAIAAHTKWKVRLRTFIDGTGEKLDSTKVAMDNQCDLGKWIYGEGSKYKSLDAYEKLRASHAQFHKCASQVVTQASAGKKADAEALIANGGSFSKLSQDTVNAIIQMRKAAG